MVYLYNAKIGIYLFMGQHSTDLNDLNHIPPSQNVPAGELTPADIDSGAYRITEVMASHVVDAEYNADSGQVALTTEAIPADQRPETTLISINGYYEVDIDTSIVVQSKADATCE